MRFSLLLADADNTLFNFHAAERAAFFAMAERFALPETEEVFQTYRRINQRHWDALQRGETTPQRIRTERFRDFAAAIGRGDLNTDSVTDCFITALGQQPVLMDGALAFVRRIAAHMPVCLATNGFSTVQRSRFERSALKPYVRDLLISEEIGASKPDPKMMFEGLRRFGLAEPAQAVMIGDSEGSDIAAATNAGIPAILFTDGAEAPAVTGAAYVARTLDDAAEWILGGDEDGVNEELGIRNCGKIA